MTTRERGSPRALARQGASLVGVVLAVASVLLVNEAAAQGQGQPWRLQRRNRLSVPMAASLRSRAVLPFYTFRHASFHGRELNTHQYGAALALGDATDLGFDWHDVEVLGRTKGSRFDSDAWGAELRYAPRVWRWPSTEAAVQLNYRRVEGFARTGDTTIDPPDATLVAVSGMASHRLNDRQTLHSRVLYQHGSLGSELDSGTVGLGVGVDHRLGRDACLEGNLGFFTEFGDADGSEFALSGGLHYGGPTGLVFDLHGTYLPSGLPLAGDPLTDAAVFRVDPTIAAQSVVRNFKDDSIGFVTVQIAYRHAF